MNEFYTAYKAWIEAMWPIEPIHFVSHASPTPLLFQNAVRDQFVNVEDAIRYQDTASEPKNVIWYDSEHWPLPEEVIIDSGKWLQNFIGSGALLLVSSPNYRTSAVIIDRLMMIWLSMSAISLVFLIWDLNHHGMKSYKRNAMWLILVGVTGVIGLAIYLVTQKSPFRGYT